MATANNEFFEALSALEKERGLPEDYLIDKIKAAIVIAVKKDYEVEDDNVVVDIDPELGAFRASLLRDIVEEVENPHTQVSLEDKVNEIRSKKSYTLFSDLPETYTDAVLSVEDHRFYGHIGIDPIAITRAMVNDMKAGRFVEGGSTITQQLAKNLYFTQEKKMERKAAEVFMAFALERAYTKNEILELYVNTIYFGNGYYCIKDASEGYFGKEPEDLTDYESTLLAGVPNAPSKYAPTVNLELAEKRQEQVVERLVACGLFTKERALETLAGSEKKG